MFTLCPTSLYFQILGTFILQNCNVTPPSIGDIRVSCNSSHQILVTVICTNCNNPNMVTSSGNSPLIVGGLDPGILYSVMINVFDGNQVVLIDQTVERTILVMGNQSGKIFIMYICTYDVHYIYNFHSILLFIFTTYTHDYTTCTIPYGSEIFIVKNWSYTVGVGNRAICLKKQCWHHFNGRFLSSTTCICVCMPTPEN